MSNLSEQIAELFAGIRRVQVRTHAEVALVGAAIIEEQILRALLTKMRPLSGRCANGCSMGMGQ